MYYELIHVHHRSPTILLWSIHWLYNKPSIHPSLSLSLSLPPPPLSPSLSVACLQYSNCRGVERRFANPGRLARSETWDVFFFFSLQLGTSSACFSQLISDYIVLWIFILLVHHRLSSASTSASTSASKQKSWSPAEKKMSCVDLNVFVITLLTLYVFGSSVVKLLTFCVFGSSVMKFNLIPDGILCHCVGSLSPEAHASRHTAPRNKIYQERLYFLSSREP